jgi:hypothetical protein
MSFSFLDFFSRAMVLKLLITRRTVTIQIMALYSRTSNSVDLRWGLEDLHF